MLRNSRTDIQHFDANHIPCDIKIKQDPRATSCVVTDVTPSGAKDTNIASASGSYRVRIMGGRSCLDGR
jgi:hypothetical protein